MRRRPEVELLESMTLLSGVAVAFPHPLVLTGSDHGTYQVKATGTTTKGSGSVSPLGHVTTSGKSISGGVGTVTLTSKAGKLFLTEHLRLSGIGSFSGTFTIAGGTKAFAGETGSGTIHSTVSGSATHGKYTITYSPAMG